MLSEVQTDILNILRNIFKSENNSYICDYGPDTASSQEMRDAVIKNGILLTVYKELPAVLREELKLKYTAGLKQSILQDHYGNMVLSSIMETGMDCIPLKGWELRRLYPNPQMRMMADIDFLVRPYDFSSICSVMDSLGFTGEKETPWKHDTFIKDEVSVEIHKRLTDDSAKIQKWENDLWGRAENNGKHLFSMSAEDFYVFHFIHLLKDFKNGKLGLRRLVDTWLLSNRHLPIGSVKEKLDDFGMLGFHDRMIKTARAAMGEEDIDDDTGLLLSHAFKYGIFGTDENYKAGRIASMGNDLRAGKIRSALAAVFLPYDRMKAHFPGLKEHPVLLPYYWIKRILGYLRKGFRKNTRRLDYSNIDEDIFRYMKDVFRAGGL